MYPAEIEIEENNIQQKETYVMGEDKADWLNDPGSISDSLLGLVFQLALTAEKSWPKLRGFSRLPRGFIVSPIAKSHYRKSAT